MLIRSISIDWIYSISHFVWRKLYYNNVRCKLVIEFSSGGPHRHILDTP